MNWFSGAFNIDPNATPEQIKRKRELVAAMLEPRRVNYAGEGLADGVAALLAGYKGRKLDRFEGERRKEASDAFRGVLNQPPPPQGPMTVLGMDPAWGGVANVADPKAVEQAPFTITPGTALGSNFGRDDLVQGLVQRGLPPAVAEGFAMNAADESGFNPGINEQAPVVPGSRGGFGLMQWTGPRRRALEAFAAERGAAVDDPNVQMDFLMTELQGPERKAAEAILASGTPGEAGAAIVSRFLRPAEEHRRRREQEYLGAGAPEPSSPGMGVSALPQYSGPPIADLQAAVMNPWLSDSERQMAASMLEQAQQASDPLRQMQMQQAGLGLQKTQMEIAQMGQPETPKPTDDMREYEFARFQGYQGTFQDFLMDMRKAGASSVNVNMGDGAPGLGKLSADYGYVLDPQTRQPVIDPATGLPKAAPVPGSPAAQDVAAAQRKATTGADAAATSGDIILRSADRALGAAGNRDMGASGTSLVGKLPWTDSAEVMRQTHALQSIATIEKLNQMRQSSPTGGALGNVTEKEGAMLAAAAGALDPNSPNYERDLKDYTHTLLRVIHGAEAGDAMFQQWQGGGLPQGAPATSDDDLLRKYGG